MLELISGGGSTAVARGASANMEKSSVSGLDFAQFLQEAQEGEKQPRADALQQQKKKPIAAEAPKKEDAKDATAETRDAGESEDAPEGGELDKTEKMDAQPLVDVRVDEMVAEEFPEEDAAYLAEELKGAWTPSVPAAKGENVEATDSGDAEDLESIEVPTMAFAAPPVENRSPLELLSFTELMDPDLVVEKNPEQIVSRIVQAAGSQSPVMEELAETVLPQVIRSMASLVRAGGAEMRLQLQPADLGEIELRVRTTEAMVRGEMLVQNPEVKQLLEQHMDRLRTALAEEGLELQGFSVDVGDPSRHARDGEGEQGRARRERGSASSTEAVGSTLSGAAAAASPRRLDNGDMDFTA